MRGEKKNEGREGPVDSIHHTVNKYVLSNFYGRLCPMDLGHTVNKASKDPALRC